MNPVPLSINITPDPRQRSYQDLKGRVHAELLNRLNLDRLTQMGQQEAEPEIRRLILDIIERGKDTTPLSLQERETLVVDVLNELFGLGPLEGLLRDSAISDILVNRFDQVYVERDDADHRADREYRRPAHRRIQPDGGRAPSGRVPSQCHHSSPCHRWSVALDSAFSDRPARRN